MCKRWYIRCHSLCHVKKDPINISVIRYILLIKYDDFLLLSENITEI